MSTGGFQHADRRRDPRSGNIESISGLPFARCQWYNIRRSGGAVLCIAPLAFLMSVPFPSGLRILKDNDQVRFIPWAWGINGAASVLGSVASIVLAMGIGFLALTLLAALIYVLGMCALLTVRSPVSADG